LDCRKLGNTNFIGRITSIKDNIATAQHWISKKEEKLKPCAGCYQNNPKLNKARCTKRIKIDKTWKIMVDSQKRLKIDRDDLKILRREIRKREHNRVKSNRIMR